jgi:uncharacterized membrane-anchored protein
MKILGLLLLALAFLAVVGGVVWTIATQAANTPVIVIVIIGAVALGFLLLLAGAIRDRLKQKKQEDFKEVKY